MILQGDCLDVLRTLPDESVQCCVTSPPYWGLRDYGVEGQLGLEPTPEAYVERMVEVFREVRRVLRDDGTVWLNLGDSYAARYGGVGNNPSSKSTLTTNNGRGPKQGDKYAPGNEGNPVRLDPGLKPKDLVGIPWRVAFALQSDGWWLRSDIIWHKPNPMPESVTDRPTKSHEYVFLLTKSKRYYYDHEAVKEASRDPASYKARTARNPDKRKDDPLYATKVGDHANGKTYPTRNRRTVWTITTKPFKGAHFATFPPDLVEPCVKAGTSKRGCCPKCGAPWKRVVSRGMTAHDGETSTAYKKGSTANRLAQLRQAARERGEEYVNRSTTIGWRPTCECDEAEPVPCVVLDPFAGAGTVGVVAKRLGREFIGVELNPEYCDMARERIEAEQPPLL